MALETELYSTDDAGITLLDSTGQPVVESYFRYFPEFSSLETWIAVFFIFVGIMIVVLLELYEKRISGNRR